MEKIGDEYSVVMDSDVQWKNKWKIDINTYTHIHREREREREMARNQWVDARCIATL